MPVSGEAKEHDATADAAALARLKYLTEVALPALARTEHWPIRFDHCFKRICFDCAFQDAWFRHIARPAERHLRGEPLTSALGCAEELLARGLPALQQRNHESLGFRGKLSKAG